MKRHSTSFAIIMSIGILLLQTPVFIEISTDFDILSGNLKGMPIIKMGNYEILSLLSGAGIVIYIYGEGGVNK